MPWLGIHSQVFYPHSYSDNGKDYEIVSMFSPNLFGNDANYKLDDSGFGKIKFDKDNKKVTITIPQGTKWDDGEPITIEDVIYPYYVIGHKDYTGVRYGSDFQNVVGWKNITQVQPILFQVWRRLMIIP